MSSSAWILTETRLQAAALAASGIQNTVFTRSQAYNLLWARLLNSAGKPVPKLIGAEYQQQLIAAVVKNIRPEYHWLYRRFHAGAAPRAGFAELQQVLQLLQTLRLHMKEEQLLRSITDEAGNVLGDSGALAELINLLGDLQELQRSSDVIDPIGIYESLLAELSLVTKAKWAELTRRLALPERIQLQAPTHIFPLEQALLLRLSQLLELRLCLPDSFLEVGGEEPAQSKRYLYSVLSFARQSEAAGVNTVPVVSAAPQRAKIVQSVFDSVQIQSADKEIRDALSGVAVWSCANRQEEVQRLGRAVRGAVQSGTAQYSDFRIFSTEPEQYRTLLEHEFCGSAALHFVSGSPAAHSMFADLLRALVQWWERPALDSALRLQIHPASRGVLLSAGCIEKFAADYAQHLSRRIDSSELTQRLCGTEVDLRRLQAERERLGLSPAGEAWNSASFRAFAREALEAGHRSLTRRDSRSGDLERYLRNICAPLVWLNEEFRRAAEFQEADNRARQLQLLRQAFSRMRWKLSALRPPEREPGDRFPQRKLSNNARALRIINSGLRLSTQAFARPNPFPDERFERGELLRIVQTILAPLHVFDPFSEEALVVGDVLDARAIAAKCVVVLGCTAEALTHRLAAEDAALLPEFAALARAIRLRSQSGLRSEEFTFLLSQLFFSAEELVFSFPRAAEKGRQEPAGFLRDLAALYPERKAHNSLKTLPEIPARRVTCILNPEGQRARQLLLARNSSAATQYDGITGGTTLELWERARKDRFFEGALYYSASALELLKEDPFLFFLRNVLQLQPPEHAQVSALPKLAGSMVHKILEQFYRTEKPGGSFAQQSRSMLRAAEIVFAEHELNWSGNPLLEVVKNGITLGLGQDDSRRRGPLAALLIYQREFLRGWPIETEWSFGMRSGSPALTIENGATRLLLRGVIDRIDRLENSELELWDYKTGKKLPGAAKVQRGESLQIPLYAAAMLELFDAKAPARGGWIDLSDPSRSDANLGSPASGVCVDVLSPPESIGAKIELAKQVVLELHERVMRGDFLASGKDFEDPHLSSLYPQDLSVLAEKAKSQAAAAQTNGPSAVSPAADTDFTTAAPRYLEVPEHTDLANLHPSAEQEAALDYDQPIALRAGAGSGKTFVLRTRVLEALLRGSPITSILAITFTEKAAEEIRTRVEQSIRSALAGNQYRERELSSAERTHLLRAKAALYQAQFGTIHGFAARIIALDPALAGLGDYERVLTGGEQKEAIEAAIRDTLADGAGTEVRRALGALHDAGVSLWSVQRELVRMLERPRRLAELRETFSETQISGGAGAALAQVVERYRKQRISMTCSRLRLEFLQWLAELKLFLATAYAAKNLTAEQKELFAAASARVMQLLPLLENQDTRVFAGLSELLTWIEPYSAIAKRRSKNVPRNFIHDLRNSLRDLEAELLILGGSWELEVRGWKIVQQLCVLAHEAQRRFVRRKQEVGAVDHEDLLTSAHAMLCADVPEQLRKRRTALVSKLRSQFRHVLVDEFQDTDHQQWELIAAIAGLEEISRSAESRSLFVVGDIQQAIYRFRGGDNRVFEMCAGAIEAGGGKRLALSRNYRSDPKVLEFLNGFFARVFQTEQVSGGVHFADTSVSYQALHAVRSPEAAEHDRIWMLPQPKSEKDYPGQKRAALEAATVAGFIAGVLSSIQNEGKSSPWRALLNHHAGPAIAVLARTVKQIQALSAALRLRGVPCTVAHGAGFYAREEIVQLEHILRICADERDSIALVGALRSPLIGLSDVELLTLFAEIGGRWEHLMQSGGAGQSELTARVRTALKRWKAYARIMPASQMLRQILRETELEGAYAAAGMASSFAAIPEFISQLEQVESSDALRRDCSAALRWMEAERQDSRKAPASTAEGQGGVVVTTVHGAKGLEFPMVVLPFLHQPSRKEHNFIVGEVFTEERSPAGQACAQTIMGVQLEDAADDFAKKKTATLALAEEAERAAQADEERRLMYVAASRAQEYLVLHCRDDIQTKPFPIQALEEPSQESAPVDSIANWINRFAGRVSA